MTHSDRHPVPAPPIAAGSPEIHLVPPRRTVHARFGDGRVYEAPVGTRLGDILTVAYPEGDSPAVAIVAASTVACASCRHHSSAMPM